MMTYNDREGKREGKREKKRERERERERERVRGMYIEQTVHPSLYLGSLTIIRQEWTWKGGEKESYSSPTHFPSQGSEMSSGWNPLFSFPGLTIEAHNQDMHVRDVLCDALMYDTRRLTKRAQVGSGNCGRIVAELADQSLIRLAHQCISRVQLRQSYSQDRSDEGVS